VAIAAFFGNYALNHILTCNY